MILRVAWRGVGSGAGWRGRLVRVRVVAVSAGHVLAAPQVRLLQRHVHTGHGYGGQYVVGPAPFACVAGCARERADAVGSLLVRPARSPGRRQPHPSGRYGALGGADRQYSGRRSGCDVMRMNRCGSRYRGKEKGRPSGWRADRGCGRPSKSPARKRPTSPPPHQTPFSSAQWFSSLTRSYAGGGTTSVLVECDGRAAYADYACPLAGRCVFWNTSAEAWSGAGCRTLVSEAGDVTCLASHLTDFSAITEALDYTRVGQHAAWKPPDPDLCHT
jgi:hypothetical protein